MQKFLPIIFLISVASLFGLSWIVVDVDPDSAPVYIFALFVTLLFLSAWGFLGLVLYFVRIKLHKRYSPIWYFKTSFKMAFFVAVFVGASSLLSILKLVTTMNIILAITALILFAVWSYLGKKG